MRVATAVRRPGPRPGPVRITVAHEQGIHAAGPVDRYTLAPYALAQTIAPRMAAIHQRHPGALVRADLGIRLRGVSAAQI